MNNLKLTFAAVAIMSASLPIKSNASELNISTVPLITHNEFVSENITKQVNSKISEVECLASVIYHESRGESKKGQIAVGYVVLNRVNNKHYPSSICKVAFQPKQFTGLKTIKYDDRSLSVAWNIIIRKYINPIKNATHFHTVQVNPSWASRLRFVAQFGAHRFYSFA